MENPRRQFCRQCGDRVCSGGTVAEAKDLSQRYLGMKLRKRTQILGGIGSRRFLELRMGIPSYSKCHSFSKLVDTVETHPHVRIPAQRWPHLGS